MADETTEETESSVITELRAKLRESEKQNKALSEQAAAGAEAVRHELYRKAGIEEKSWGLMDRATATMEDADEESIKALAEEAGLIAEPQPTAGAGEIQSHEAIAAAAGDAPAIPPGLEDRISEAQTEEEVLALALEGGMPVVTQ